MHHQQAKKSEEFPCLRFGTETYVQFISKEIKMSDQKSLPVLTQSNWIRQRIRKEIHL
jgi:hypothetical protein